jgi:hypothetical protein
MKEKKVGIERKLKKKACKLIRPVARKRLKNVDDIAFYH